MTDATRIDAAELLRRVRAIVPELAAQAEEAERLRRPTDAAIRALEETGVFRMMVPRRYGGLELDLDAFLEVGLALAEADASIAWVADFYIEHNWMFCQFPEAFQAQLYADRSFVLAPAAIAPAGQAQPENGGYRLRGRWKWGTGAMHADWAIVGAASGPADEAGSFRFFALPLAEARVEDTWYVDGMVATGSNDIVIDDVFVPAERSVSIPEMVSGSAEGAKIHEGPLYRTPMLPILMLAASMPIVGGARAAVHRFRELVGEHVRLPTSQRRAEKPAVQMRLARASIEARQAELVLRDVVGELCELRDRAEPQDRARWSSSITHAVHQSRRVISDIAEASGASAHFLDQPLQRALRDVNVASCHVVFDRDAQLELYGRLLLGLEPNSGFF